MKKNAWVVDYVIANYENMSDREMAANTTVNYVSIFNIRKKYKLERTPEFNHNRRVLSGTKGGAATHSRHDMSGENNSNWKGGRSKSWKNYPPYSKGKYPEKEKARKILNSAIERSKINKSPCMFCENPKVEAHHEDYSKPLAVVWVCKKHHTDIHHNRLTKQDKDALTQAVIKAGKLLIPRQAKAA